MNIEELQKRISSKEKLNEVLRHKEFMSLDYLSNAFNLKTKSIEYEKPIDKEKIKDNRKILNELMLINASNCLNVSVSTLKYIKDKYKISCTRFSNMVENLLYFRIDTETKFNSIVYEDCITFLKAMGYNNNDKYYLGKLSNKAHII